MADNIELQIKPILNSRMDRLINIYLEHIRYERNFAESTIVSKGKQLQLFLRFAGRKTLNTRLIQDFLRYLAIQRGWQPISLKDALRDIKCFTKYLYFSGKEKEDFAYRIPYPKLPETLPRVISAETVEKLYTQPMPPKACKRIWITYNFYFELLAKAGLRKTESKLLTRNDFDFQTGILHVFAKGRRDTYCLIPPDMTDRLKEWFEERELLPDDLAFVGRDGKVLNNEAIRFALQYRARRAGINQRVYPHLLRHFFGTDLVRNGVDIEKVRRLMRHKRITTTQIYLDLVPDDLRNDLLKHSLINKKEKQAARKKPRKKPMIVNIYNPTFTTPVNPFELSRVSLIKERGHNGRSSSQVSE